MTVTPNIIDRVCLAVMPQYGARRMRARLELDGRERMLGMMARYYDASRPSRATYGWLASFTDPNAEIWASLAALRARSRELGRNNPNARKAIASLVNNSIGTGILPRANTGDPELNKRVDALFGEYSAQADAEGHYDFFGLQKLALRSFFEAGEALVRRVPRPLSFGLTVPIQYQVLEPDFIDHNKNMVTDDGRIIQGVELARGTGLRRAYWLFEEHPGEMPLTRRGGLVSRPQPAENFMHLYEKERPGQQRGVPWLYAVMVKLRELGTYEEAELIRKRLEACFAAIVTNPEGLADLTTGEISVTPGITDMAGNKVESLEPGLMFYARGGSDIKFAQPTAMGGYADYKREELHSVAAGALITYELLTGDLTRVNYSSIRAGMLEYRRLIESLQWTTIIPVLCNPMWRDFINYGVAVGKLPMGTPYGVTHSPPRFESIDPLKDSMSDLIDTRAGFTSTPRAITRRGDDPFEILNEQAEFLKVANSLGLVLDSDPSKVARSTGQSQPNPPGETEAGDGDGGQQQDSEAFRAVLGLLKDAGLNGSAEGIARRAMAILAEEGRA